MLDPRSALDVSMEPLPVPDKKGLVANEVPMDGCVDDGGRAPAAVNKRGLTILTAAVFIVGEMAGGGILSLPDALKSAGWSGILLLIFCAFLSAYTGIVLGRSWQILKDRFPFYREHIRYPYPAIGFEAMGKAGRYAVTLCVNLTLFSVTTVFLLVSSQLFQTLLQMAEVNISFCAWVPIIAAVLCPLTWLGTPKDFWPIAAGAAVSTGLACILIFAQEMEDLGPTVSHPSPTFQSFFTAFGAILFAFGGHAIFPTVQHDMKDTRKFHWTVLVAYIVVVAYYLPVSVGGYVVYGAQIEANLLKSLTPGTVTTIVIVMIMLHLLMGVVIVINPFCQEIEEFLKIPLKFGWKRIVLRTVVMAAVLFMAETIPKFSVILNLIGGTTVTLLTFVYPSLFYILLRRQESPDNAWVTGKIEIWEYVLHAEIILIGLVGGVASTYSEIYDIATATGPTLTVPCYINSNQTG
ncbi:amino acid transporter AVT1E-like [Acanthaster planci]|uniref:Amino acid transporter AVT1E-like n=1 Tax=Acanthaster planci TaxID=133434 RepID=A0A8B8A7M9_ACAPL|nr:amino acid transporter AVT1E-like [Acanthaster planci]XP_022112041.1 amino acid transporter AVT1E-like [Acanthaster planci]